MVIYNDIFTLHGLDFQEEFRFRPEFDCDYLNSGYFSGIFCGKYNNEDVFFFI